MKTMPTDGRCPECGAAIPAGATDGLCAQCLFSLGLEVPDASAPPLSSPTPTPTPALGAGSQPFGDYELLGEIARGGMGVVFKARQISLNRTVAVKMIQDGRFARREFIHRFKV